MKTQRFLKNDEHYHLSITLEPGDTPDKVIGTILGNCCWDIDWDALDQQDRDHMERRLSESFLGIKRKGQVGN